MAFSFIVEMLNMTMMSRAKKRRGRLVHLNEPHLEGSKKKDKDLAE